MDAWQVQGVDGGLGGAEESVEGSRYGVACQFSCSVDRDRIMK
jgi:hypothetical protein